MMRLQKYIFFIFVILLVVIIYIGISEAQQKQSSTSGGRYQLISGQYEDNSGNVRHVVLRIDTQTGKTHRLEYYVAKIEGNYVRLQYFSEVYNTEIEMLQAIIATEKTMKKK